MDVEGEVTSRCQLRLRNATCRGYVVGVKGSVALQSALDGCDVQQKIGMGFALHEVSGAVKDVDHSYISRRCPENSRHITCILFSICTSCVAVKPAIE